MNFKTIAQNNLWRVIIIKKRGFLIGFMVFLVTLNSTNVTAYSEIIANYTINQPGNLIFNPAYTTNTTDLQVQVKLTCHNCTFDFWIEYENNKNITAYSPVYSRTTTLFKIQNQTAFNIEYNLNTTGTYYFRFVDSMKQHEYTLNIDVYMAILHPGLLVQTNQKSESTHPIIDQSSSNELFIGLLVVFILGVGFLFGFTKWKARGPKELAYPKRVNYQPVEPVIRISNKIIPSEVLQQYWYCPEDNSRLQVVTSRTAENPAFIVSKNNIKNGINNAIAMRKINPEVQEQTERLANYLLETYTIEELYLVSTRCPICAKYYTAPQT